jgi:Holliday junction DNA helicase RuvA
MDVRVFVPTRTAELLHPGAVAELHTHFALHGDQRSLQASLYGFDSVVGLDLFELLITVSGIGPKAALALLSTLEVDEVRRAIIAGDQKSLSRAPGIGARVANRIVGELQDKLVDMPPTAGEVADGYGAALSALVSLGYSPLDARQALEKTPVGAPTEELVRAALEALARGAPGLST